MEHKYVRTYSILIVFENKMFLYKYCMKQSVISSIPLSLLYLAWTEMVVADIENKFANFQLQWSNESLRDNL